MTHTYQEEIYHQFSRNTDNSLQDGHIRWRRQASGSSVNAPITAFEVIPSSLMHDVNNPTNEAELKVVHDGAHPTAMFYITSILIMYLFGLLLIFVHYMNSSYGKWNWTPSDAWDELTPAFFNQSQQTSNETGGKNTDKKPKWSISERTDVLVGEEEEVRFLPDNGHNWKSNLDSSNVSSGCSGQTGMTSLPSDGEEISSVSDKKKSKGTKNTGKTYLSPSSANKKNFFQRKSNTGKSEFDESLNSEYHVKSSSDATVVTAVVSHTEDHDQNRTTTLSAPDTFQQHVKTKEEEIIVISDESSNNLS